VKSSRIIFVLSFAACGLVQGCAHKQPLPTEDEIPKMETRSASMQMSVTQQPTAVAHGKTPLVYIFATGGPVRVVDVTANIAVGAAVVGNQTLVRVDDRHGVIAGNKTITAGPLPAGHEYVIYADPTTDNVMQNSIMQPGSVSR
jgi:hypothetical protein